MSRVRRLRCIAGLVLGSAWLAACGQTPGTPEVVGSAPEFELVDQSGAAFGSAGLRDRVWVANFVFTRCGHTCPRLSARMAKLQQSLRDQPFWSEVRLVSFSVDPEHDRPEVLTRYASRFGADSGHWSFLTGDRSTLWKLSRDGFKLAVGEAPGNPDEPLFHSAKFVLVDRRGGIRGYYDALEDEAFASLLSDLRAVAAEDASPS